MTNTPKKQFREEKVDYTNLQNELTEKGIKYAFGSYVDIHGISKSKLVPIKNFNDMMNGSELYTVTALDAMGGAGPQDDECQAIPDVDSMVILPWKKDIAWFASNLYYHGEKYSHCSRVILSNMMKKANDMGFEFMLGIEPEFYVFKENENKEITPYDKEDTLTMPGYDVRTTLHSLDFLDEMVRSMNDLGWDVNSFDHEGGNGQYEFDFSYSNALTTADRLTFFRLMAREIANKYDAFASFMPKPFSDNFGSGAHHNMSLFNINTNENAFIDKQDPRNNGLSQTAYYFIGGLLKHAEALAAISCPLVNSYKRLIPRGMMPDISWAPVYITYGRNNRTAMLRVPKNRPAIENRVPDISANFYLTSALHLAAGLDGIINKIDPGDPVDMDLYKYSDKQLTEINVGTLPKNLMEAVEAFESSDLVKETFGSTIQQEWADLKRKEWADYHYNVSQYERDKYLKLY
jgi:glutamine synthetase